jgi:Co/Zn/Cd efflux system component
MNRTVFHVARMDCPSEERMIRMALDGLPFVHAIDVDLARREIAVAHDGPVDEVLARLLPLKLGTEIRETREADDRDEGQPHDERGILVAVLAINAAFFAAELLFGFLASSMGLVADSLDMLADAIVYALSLYAVGGGTSTKKRIAAISGYAQMLLAALGFVEVIRRFIGRGEFPDAGLMIAVSALALAGNAACLLLLQRSRNREAHMQASLIFTSNDVVANAGVILAGLLVAFFHTGLPDLLIGAVVFALVMRGALRILKLSR